MAPMKTSKISGRKKAKAVEWKDKHLSRGTGYIPVAVGTSMDQQTARRDAIRMEIDNHQAVLNMAVPASMDVDETFQIEELDALDDLDQTQSRVSSPTCLSLMPFDIALSHSEPSAPTWKSLFLGLADT
jgi:hypothetical protein